MSVPVNIRANVRVPFPALVQGTFPVTITKANGIWSISVDIAGLADIIAGELGGIPPVYRAVTTTPVTVLSTPLDTYIGVDTVAINAPWQLNLVTAVSRNGFPLWIKDITGSARTFNGSFLPATGDAIEGTLGISSNLMNIDRQTIGLLPVTQGTGSPGWIRID